MEKHYILIPPPVSFPAQPTSTLSTATSHIVFSSTTTATETPPSLSCQLDAAPQPSAQNTPTTAAIAASASLNSELLHTLRTTSDAPLALSHITTHIAILKDEIAAQQTALNALTARVDEQFRLHKALRDSVGRKWGSRLTNTRRKFEARARAAEESYTAGVQGRSRAQGRLESLAQELAESLAEQTALRATADRHASAHARIDDLYAAIFDGPTPGFPAEDAAEQSYLRSRRRHEDSTARVASCVRVVRLLKQAAVRLQRARNHMVQAKAEGAAGLVLVLSGAYEDLRRSEHFGALVLVAVERAVEGLQPLDGELRELRRAVVKGVHAAVVEKKSVASRLDLLEKIAASEKSFDSAKGALDNLIKTAKEREMAARTGVRFTAGLLEEARQALQQVRQEAFEMVVGFGAAPPAYHECCNRAESFEHVEVEVDGLELEMPDMDGQGQEGDDGGREPASDVSG